MARCRAYLEWQMVVLRFSVVLCIYEAEEILHRAHKMHRESERERERERIYGEIGTRFFVKTAPRTRIVTRLLEKLQLP